MELHDHPRFQAAPRRVNPEGAAVSGRKRAGFFEQWVYSRDPGLEE